MTLTITPESPLSPDGLALIDASQQALEEVFAPEDIFSFSPEELALPEVTFLVARQNANPMGCVAMVDCGDYAEVKRLYVGPAGRGKGVARALMAELEARAGALGHRYVRLETGDALGPATTLYRSLGYGVRGPFGNYPEHPASLFMEKPL